MTTLSSRTPYIGVTDVPSFSRASDLYHHFLGSLRSGVHRSFHVGVMTSRKILLGEPTRWAAVYPQKEILAGILSHPLTYNCVHYADYDDLGVDEHLDATLSCVADYAGARLDAIQLDMIWPNPHLLARFKGVRECELILQIGRKALDIVGDNATQLCARLRSYEGIVERLLLDMSGGEGREMQSERLLPYLRLIRDQLPDFSLGVAGGLGPYSLHLLEPILPEFPNISIDAQGQLRNSGNAMDPIDWWRAEKYLTEALRILDQ